MASQSVWVLEQIVTDRLGGLSTTGMYFSQFWRLGDQDQGIGMVG